MFMNKFDEKMDAWLAGNLTGKELEQFEASLPSVSEAELAEQETQPLNAMLKEHLSARPMSNADFFNHQLLQEIEREERTTAPRAEEQQVRTTWWSIGRLAWAGAASLLVAGAITLTLMREEPVGGQSTYLTQIINARVDPQVSPNATISIFEKQEERVTVIWVEGLQQLPAEYAAK
jgi:hypothetical protein